MTITATNGNIESRIVEYCKDIVRDEYCYFLCGTDSREWYFCMSAHQSGNEYTDCIVYRIWYDTYLPQNPATTIFMTAQNVDTVYFQNPQNFMCYTSDVLGANLCERKWEREEKACCLVFCGAIILAVFTAVFGQILRRYG